MAKAMTELKFDLRMAPYNHITIKRCNYSDQTVLAACQSDFCIVTTIVRLRIEQFDTKIYSWILLRLETVKPLGLLLKMLFLIWASKMPNPHAQHQSRDIANTTNPGPITAVAFRSCKIISKLWSDYTCNGLLQFNLTATSSQQTFASS
ncbi:unnamed protein product [Brugia timori]|uniref:Uncharacterized protein n=1 Tax=Brugia timori TaxID=42155 RepID=A0A0R3QSN2_9BILA|nr:unnamed protein product [Brugia timori]